MGKYFSQRSKVIGKLHLTVKTFSLLLILNVSMTPSNAQEQIVPYTLADRDKATRTETKLEALEKKMDIKFEALEKKIDTKFESVDVKFASVDAKFDAVNKRIDYLFWMMGVMVALILFILGYTIWDRRTALKPALDKAETADYRSLTLTRALRDYSKDHPDLAEYLKIHGLL